MDKIKKGMYVRTKEGYIARIININEFNYIDFDNTIIKNFGDEFSCWELERLEIFKASYDIIDLIQVGDYVNGKKVIEIDYAESGKYVMVDDNDKGWRSMYFNNQIKSIVTKEQFESMKYEV